MIQVFQGIRPFSDILLDMLLYAPCSPGVFFPNGFIRRFASLLGSLGSLGSGLCKALNCSGLCDPGEASRSGLTRITRTNPEALGRRSAVAGCPGAAQGLADFPGFTAVPVKVLSGKGQCGYRGAPVFPAAQKFFELETRFPSILKNLG